jgi:trimethylamine---corrinoid protein Co-methyltransferase
MRRNIRAGAARLEGLGLRALTDDGVDAVHLATLEVLDRGGISVEADDALDILADGGCMVDRQSRIARIPPWVVEEAIAKSPSTFVMAGRDPKNDVVIGGGRIGFTNFTEGIMMNDLATGENRPSMKQDVADCARAVDAMSEIDIHTLAVGARDCPVIPTVHGYEAALASTTKHTLIPGLTALEMQACIDMAALVMGGHDALRERPIVSAGCSPVSPLQMTRECSDVILTMARNGLPSCAPPCAMGGATSPVTLAGTVVQHNAEALAALVLVELAEPGAKYIYASSTATMDLRWAADAVGTPEMALIGACLSQMARSYGIPTFIAGL